MESVVTQVDGVTPAHGDPSDWFSVATHHAQSSKVTLEKDVGL